MDPRLKGHFLVILSVSTSGVLVILPPGNTSQGYDIHVHLKPKCIHALEYINQIVFSPDISVGINSSAFPLLLPRSLHVQSPKAGRHVWDFEEERKDQQKMNVCPTCTS